MKQIRILFISIEGNTRSFVNHLVSYAEQQHQIHPTQPLITATEISDQTDLQAEHQPYFVFVPTYLDGGNGIDNGVKELMTNSMGEYLDFQENAQYCQGIIGSGNKNFNAQYCLTAKRYARKFQVPFIADYELRGNHDDLERIYADLVAFVAEQAAV
ncbi:Ribonucleotide reduction protein NrdI [Fructilactobacillus florum 8D]|uniref:Ribonucleotide reduction protein NrdI n=1 Tax=Fructilactobacillus florum 8D TaxID=1221538 RepID=W9EHI6_9LACO|nr:class Ib ribonucleoside-diphosphate reductase assembly flavoprotein NrdI [Fructilactobacillus florum]ETO40726.1 Ribonucleotide reduction protein NrdI [Fructilactobacillus florum 8D]